MESFTTIDVETAEQKLTSGYAVLIDIRDERSYKAASVKGSYRLTDATLNEFLQAYEFDTPIMVLCYHGISSRGAAQFLVNQGFEEVYSVNGGIEAWYHRYPEQIETGEASAS